MPSKDPDLFIKFVDGFTIERSDNKGNATAVQGHRIVNRENGSVTSIHWSVALYDPYSSAYMGTRTYKTLGGMYRGLRKHCTAMLMDFDALEHKVNLTNIMVDNPNCAKDVAEQKYSSGYRHDLVDTYYINGSCHIENGIWLTRCNYCDVAVAHYGVIPRHMLELGQHEVQEHNAQVAGINAGILP